MSEQSRTEPIRGEADLIDNDEVFSYRNIEKDQSQKRMESRRSKYLSITLYFRSRKLVNKQVGLPT